MKIYASVFSSRSDMRTKLKYLSKCESLADAQIKSAKYSKHIEFDLLECYQIDDTDDTEYNNHREAGFDQFPWSPDKGPVSLIHTDYKKGFHPIGEEPVDAPYSKGRENCYGFGVIINQGDPDKERKCVVIFDSGEKTETAKGTAKKFEMLAMAIRDNLGVPFEVPFIGNELNADDYPPIK